MRKLFKKVDRLFRLALSGSAFKRSPRADDVLLIVELLRCVDWTPENIGHLRNIALAAIPVLQPWRPRMLATSGCCRTAMDQVLMQIVLSKVGLEQARLR